MAVTRPDGTLAGLVTDGDVRRAFAHDVSAIRASDIMTAQPIVVAPDARMSDVVDLLTTHSVQSLLVVEDGRPLTVAHIAELMQAGYVT